MPIAAAVAGALAASLGAIAPLAPATPTITHGNRTVLTGPSSPWRSRSAPIG